MLALVTCVLVAAPMAGRALGSDYLLVTGSEYPPYADDKLADGGLAPRIVKLAFAAIGKSVTIQVMPWSRGYAMTMAGKVDGTFPYASSEVRQRDMVASEPIMIIESHLWTAPGQPIRRFSAALAGKRFCLPVGYSPPAPLQAMIDSKAITLTTPRNLENCVRMIGGNHADFTSGDPNVLRSVFHDIGIDLVEGEDVLQTRPLMILAAKNNPRTPALIADFNRGLTRIKADGSYDQLIRRVSHS